MDSSIQEFNDYRQKMNDVILYPVLLREEVVGYVDCIGSALSIGMLFDDISDVEFDLESKEYRLATVQP